MKLPLKRTTVLAGILSGAAIAALAVSVVLAAVGDITTVAGNGLGGFDGDGGPATSKRLRFPGFAVEDTTGNLFIADGNNDRVRRVDVGTGIITTVAGTGTAGFSRDTGPATNAALNNPSGLVIDGDGNLFIADYNNDRIRMVTPGADGEVDGDADDIITTVVGDGGAAFGGDGGPATSATLNFPESVAVDASGNRFIADSSHRRIRRVTPGADGQVDGDADDVITTVAGTGGSVFFGDGGPATAAAFVIPRSLTLDAAGNLFISDTNSHRIRRVSSGADEHVDGDADEIILTVAGKGTGVFAGDGGAATDAFLDRPLGVVVDADGNLFIADWDNNRIRMVTAGGDGKVDGDPDDIITTIAGTGAFAYSGDGGPAVAANLKAPRGVSMTPTGLLIADTASHAIRKIEAEAPPAPPPVPGLAAPGLFIMAVLLLATSWWTHRRGTRRPTAQYNL